MNVSKKGGTAAPFVALGLLAVCTMAWGLWNRGMVPSLVPPSPTPSPLPTTPYYVQVHIGKHFDEDKNLVLEVPFRSDGKQHRVYEKKKGVRWLIDIEAHRTTGTGVRVSAQVKKTDTSHGAMPRQALFRGGYVNVIDTPIPAISYETGKTIPEKMRWAVLVSSKPSQEAITDGHFLH